MKFTQLCFCHHSWSRLRHRSLIFPLLNFFLTSVLTITDTCYPPAPTSQEWHHQIYVLRSCNPRAPVSLSNVTREYGIKNGYAKCTRRAGDNFLGHCEYGAGGPWLPRAVANGHPRKQGRGPGHSRNIEQSRVWWGVTNGRELPMRPKELGLKGRCDGLSPL